MTNERHYPRPRPEDYQVHRLVHDLLTQPRTFQAFKESPDEVLGSYDLDDDAKEAMRQRDFDSLRERGIHAILLIQLYRLFEWQMPSWSVTFDGHTESGHE